MPSRRPRDSSEGGDSVGRSPAGRDHSPREDDDEGELEVEESFSTSPIPFYNTTFSAHRVSPLYLGREALSAGRLQVLALRLRDKLVGDVVRGVEVGSAGEDAIVGRAGALERVEIHWERVVDLLGMTEDVVGGIGREGERSWRCDNVDWQRLAALLPRKKALHIALRYELASCTALLLPPLTQEVGGSAGVEGGGTEWERSDATGSLSLPLLLLRMPAPLKTIVGDFLAANFDCRVSPMRLGTQSLISSWEAWIRCVDPPPRGPLARDVVLSLGFYLPPAGVDESGIPPSGDPTHEPATAEQPLGLRSIDVIVPAAELPNFRRAGSRPISKLGEEPATKTFHWRWEDDPAERKKLAGHLSEEGWEWRPRIFPAMPFTEALAWYLKKHLALNLFHPGVRVTKVACRGFVMSETRLKLFTPAGAGEVDGDGSLLGRRGAVLALLQALVKKAQLSDGNSDVID